MRFCPTFPAKFSKLALSLTGLAILAGCAAASISMSEMKLETARRIAHPAWMVQRDIPAGQFVLRGYERMHERHAPANLYIEGDGEGIKGMIGDPTPRNPLALHLASKDKAENLAYLARPCMYLGIDDEEGGSCTHAVWRDGRYSEDVVKAYELAMDEIAKRYDIKGFNLIGYDGGGAIAMLLAARRSDVLTVRTVAGILDPDVQRRIIRLAPLTGSLNPAKEAKNLTMVPQYHFVGGLDEITPPAVLQSYMQASPPSSCIQSMVVQEAGHFDGWVNKWPELLELPVDCFSTPQATGFGVYDSPDDAALDSGAPTMPPVYRTVRETPEKP